MKYFEEETKDIYELSAGRKVYSSQFINIPNHTNETLAHHLGVEDLLVNRFAQYPNLWHTHAMVALQAQEFGLLLYIMSETWEAGYDRMYTSGKRLRDWANNKTGFGIDMIPSASEGFKAWLEPLEACGAIEVIKHTQTNRPYTEIRICRGTFLAENFYKANDGRGKYPRKKGKVDPEGITGMYNPKRKPLYTSKEILEGILGNNYAKRTGLFANSEDTQNNENPHSRDANHPHSRDANHPHSGQANSSKQSPTGGESDRKIIKDKKIYKEEEEKTDESFHRAEMQKSNNLYLEFVDLLRTKYQGLELQFNDQKFFINREGFLCSMATDKKVASGMATTYYKKMFANKEKWILWLDQKFDERLKKAVNHF